MVERGEQQIFVRQGAMNRLLVLGCAMRGRRKEGGEDVSTRQRNRTDVI